MERSLAPVSQSTNPAASGTTEHDLGPVLAAGPGMLGVLRRRMPWLVDPEDVLQQAYEKALTARGTLRDRTRLVPWFRRLLANTAIDETRRRATDARVRHDLGADPSLTLDPDVHAASACPCLGKAVRDLPSSYRHVVEQVYVEDGAVTDVARDLGTTTNNVRVRLHRARSALRRNLAPCEPGPAARCGDCHCAL
jgi:RNA polymerase sigma factor (sigma-70 family)